MSIGRPEYENAWHADVLVHINPTSRDEGYHSQQHNKRHANSDLLILATT